VGRETVRTQIEAVYTKTGVQRQGQFIRLALTIPAPPDDR
jgi:DNA-binding CsgD family transcriptional regulator